MRQTVIEGLDPATYRRHALHGEQSVWLEKNCYIDLWIEALHALGLEPLAMLSFTLATDFEGDQWTFFKPGHGELRELYGVEVQELTIWRSLLEHAQEHLADGKLIATESDSFWLPDVAGTDYRQQHGKTTIVLNELDLPNRRLGYFHNAGYYVLEGEDFVKTFRLDADPDAVFLPLFAEFVRKDRMVRRPPAELAALAAESLRRHLRHTPAVNPLSRFRERFERELPNLQERGLAYYHVWAFSTIRQLGAAFELASEHLKWLGEAGGPDVAAAAVDFAQIASGSKTLILKAARAVNARRSFDSYAMFDDMAAAWQRGVDTLKNRL